MGALKGLRKDKSAENLLSALLLHLGVGHSLRETAARAREAGLAELSAVALFKRLRKSGAWLRTLCAALFRGRGARVTVDIDREGFVVRRAIGRVQTFRFPQSESALLAGMTAENVYAGLLADPSDCELGL